LTLLIAVFAAVISTLVWYNSKAARQLKVGVLCWMFWGASLMWLGDAIFAYMELQAAYFTPAPADMLNDLFLGLSVVALAMVIWIAVLLIKDPNGVIKERLSNRE